MSTDIQAPQNFQERMAARVRESIGDLITDTELKVLIERAMHDAFFKERVINPGSYNSTTEPSFFVKLIENEMRARVHAEIETWVEGHPEEITKTLDEALAKGMFDLMKQHFVSQTTWPMQQMFDQLRQRGIL